MHSTTMLNIRSIYNYYIFSSNFLFLIYSAPCLPRSPQKHPSLPCLSRSYNNPILLLLHCYVSHEISINRISVCTKILVVRFRSSLYASFFHPAPIKKRYMYQIPYEERMGICTTSLIRRKGIYTWTLRRDQWVNIPNVLWKRKGYMYQIF